ncbi:methyltransferase [Martensiomyces pterosporus]|nr:methyltransferase [Martensiomyces pterosporus]
MSEKRQPGTPPVDVPAHPQKKQASSVAEISQVTAEAAAEASDGNGGKFGSRMLSSDRDVFEHNAWDHVEPDSDHLKYAEEQIRLHNDNPVPKDEKEKYNADPAAYWDSFYQNNQNKFFKDRHWLRLEFAELFNWTNKRFSATKDGSSDEAGNEPTEGGANAEAAAADNGVGGSDAGSGEKFRIMEVGCGAGNAVFPLLADIYDPRLFVYACDYSKAAVSVVKANDAYKEERCKAFVWDLASTEIPPCVEPGSIDVMLMIFVFSALHPDQWKQAAENAYKVLKPGGLLLFRDYGRHDLAQLRFKKSRLLDSNFYIRGDGTRVYFFTNDELAEIFGPKFKVEQNAIDRRLIVNRKRELKMYRVWLQAKFRKPITED